MLMFCRLSFVGTIVICVLPAAALGQSRSTVEVEFGPGFAIGSGSENPAPSLPTLSLGAVVWLVERWGIAVTHVRSYGEDLREPPVESMDRVFGGAEDLQYTRAVARYRRGVFSAGDIVLGVGFVFGGSFTDIDFLKTPAGLERLRPKSRWGGFAVEGYFQRFWRAHIGVRVGSTLDTNVETTAFEPVMLGVFAF
jgi:hypothetical protein